RLARAGIGIWPAPGRRPTAAPVDRVQALVDLGAIGYATPPASSGQTVAAFQRRFRQSRCDGRIDRETADPIGEVRPAYDALRGARAERVLPEVGRRVEPGPSGVN